jgi:hypothetical protein
VRRRFNPISTQDHDFNAQLTVNASHADQRNNYISSLSLNQLETEYLPTTVTPLVQLQLFLTVCTCAPAAVIVAFCNLTEITTDVDALFAILFANVSGVTKRFVDFLWLSVTISDSKYINYVSAVHQLFCERYLGLLEAFF